MQENPERINDMDFESCVRRLDKIVNQLESGQVPLDEAIALFEEGQALGQRCGKLLDEAELRVERLLERPDGSAATEPFEAE